MDYESPEILASYSDAELASEASVSMRYEIILT
jgi:hypothetical protein